MACHRDKAHPHNPANSRQRVEGQEISGPGVVPRPCDFNYLRCQTTLTAIAGAQGIFLHCQTGKFSTPMLGHATHEHDVRHRLKHTEAVDPPRHPDGQAFAGELIDQCHQPQLAAIVGLGLHKVIGPDMIASFRS